MSRLSAITSFLIMPPVLLAALLFTTACGDSKGAKAAAPQAMPVKVQTAKFQKVDDTTDYVATLKSRDSAAVRPQVEGIITKIFVHSGQRVAAGAPLMQIDPAKQQAAVISQENARAAQLAQVKWAKQNYDRVSGLANAGVVSKQELDQARATLDAAEAQLHSLEAQVREQQVQLHYYQVVAPRAGIVGDVPVRVGDRVLTTTTLTTVEETCSRPAVSRSSRRKWTPRRSPCSPKRQSRTRKTACAPPSSSVHA